MKFLVAPDKFKGCLGAERASLAMEKGIRDVFPFAVIHCIPLADGGDGTADILGKAFKARVKRNIVRGPDGRKIVARWWLRDQTAWMDMASASGLARTHGRNPWKASSFGTGQLLDAAVRAGAKKIILGVGGSATVDGGSGAMKALGIRFLDERGRPISEGGRGLLHLKRLEIEGCRWKRKSVRLIILADVTNPLLGPQGAAPVFGPQKGASPSMVQKLSRGLKQMDLVTRRQFGKSMGEWVSGGAAGGMAAGMVGILGQVEGVRVDLAPGAEFVLKTLRVKPMMRKVDGVLTGEGKLDSQTMHGKTVAGVTRLAKELNRPVLAFAGKLELRPREIQRMGLHGAYQIAPESCPLRRSFKHAFPWLRKAVRNAIQSLKDFPEE